MVIAGTAPDDTSAIFFTRDRDPQTSTTINGASLRDVEAWVMFVAALDPAGSIQCVTIRASLVQGDNDLRVVAGVANWGAALQVMREMQAKAVGPGWEHNTIFDSPDFKGFHEDLESAAIQHVSPPSAS